MMFDETHRGSKRLNRGAVNFDRKAPLEEVDLQHQFEAVSVLQDLTAQTGQRAADDSSKRSGPQPLLACDRLARPKQSIDVQQLSFNLLLIVDAEGADDLFQLDGAPTIRVICHDEDIARKEGQMRADEPPLVALSTLDLWQEIGDAAAAELARDSPFRVRTNVTNKPGLGIKRFRSNIE
jgi:hypothetical protein